MGWRIGVDIGGTFTDVVVVEETGGRPAVVKVSTTPRDFARGVLDALAEAMRRHGVAADRVTLLAHATTIVTNALLRYDPFAGVMGSTVIFALMHGINNIFPAAVVAGLATAEVFRRSGSIWPAPR